MAKPDRTAFDAAKAAHKQAVKDYEATARQTEAAVEAGELDEAGAALILEAALVQLKAATDAFEVAVKANHKPKKTKPDA